jgi:sirohydrochlorin ferrochelatase
MFEVVEVIRARGVYPIVEVGFMECNEPDIPTAIDSCVSQGATEIVAVPYFLHTGNHVADDLPRLLEEAQLRYPDIRFRLGEFLGRAPQLTDILVSRAKAV